ncbi:MAG: TIGR04086 family membrane protein [Eubacteriales bacterium]|nr:TIGR04086 family membrane protein [Eubacteriales bacterium]
MERNRKETGIAGWILKSLLIAYVLTGALLLVLAMLLYKMDMDEKTVSAGIIAIYITATLIGGLAIGKMAKARRFLWGLILGILYFALLILITLGVYRTLDGAMGNYITTFLLCAGGGMIGGMIS